MAIADDPRIDPRIRALFGAMPPEPPQPDAVSREQMLAEEATDEAKARAAAQTAMMEMFDSEAIVPSAGLTVTVETFTSQPDGNTIKVRLVRPETGAPHACVAYIHGGGMQTMSAFDGIYRTWGRLIAHQGVAVAFIDFRNALRPSSAPEVAPFPAGLNDCVSGVKWLSANAGRLGLNPDRIVIAGESGGGNLTLATGLKLKRDGDIGLVKGLYALCPYIAGHWPQDRYPSSIENNGLLIDLHGNRGAMAYGIGELEAGNPLAWPGFATEADVKGLPPVVVNVNECDPLRDEGIVFYRLLLAAGVPARCRQVMGTIHAGDLMVMACPDVAADTARDIAAFAKG
jgi:acetyl esterase/lipase